MILPDNQWDNVSRYFTDDEKLDLQAATLDEPLIERGFIVNEKRLDPELRAKVKFYFMTAVPFPARIARTKGAAL